MEITKKPFLMSFAGNPMRYLLSPGGTGGGGLPMGGVLSVIQMEFTGIDTTPDHSVDVTFLDETRTFILKSECTDKDHIPVPDESWDEILWCKAIFEYFLNDVQLLQYYDITAAAEILTMTAKVASPDYDWTTDSNTITGITITNIANGQDPPAGTVEGVMMTVMKNGTEILGSDYKPLAADGTVKFEISEYLYASLLQAVPPRFHLSVVGFYTHVFTDYILKYRTIFCDKISGVFSPRSYSDPANVWCYALAGGLNREDLVANNILLSDFFNKPETKKKFMTWSPPARLTDKVETHSLFFAFQSPAYTTCKLKANLYNTELGIATSIDITSQTGISRWCVVEYMAGYAQLHLSAYMNGNVDMWELYLIDGDDNIISDIRQFVLDKKYTENTRYFRFRNSWGAYDSLRCVGNFETIEEHDRQTVMYMSDEIESSYNTPGSDTMIKESQSFKANTGWLTRDYLHSLRDFMLSSDIFEVDEGRLLKCLLTSKKTSLFKDDDYNYNLAFEYERAYDDFFFQISE